MTRHEVKTWPREWAAVASGAKTADLRRADRDYQVGDLLVLREYDMQLLIYTDRVCERRITHVLHCGQGGQFGLTHDHVMLSLAPVPAGYIAAGKEGGFLVGLRLNPYQIEVHPTKEAGLVELVECHGEGYTDWRLYAMTEVETTGGG